MESLPVTSSAAILQSNSRSTSPARPGGLVLQSSRQHATATLKKSEPLIVMRSRRKSPLLARKPTPGTGSGTAPEVTTTSSQQAPSAATTSVTATMGSSTSVTPQQHQHLQPTMNPNQNLNQSQNQMVVATKSQSGSSSQDETAAVVSGGSSSASGSAVGLTVVSALGDDLGESSAFEMMSHASNGSSSELLIPPGSEDVVDGSGAATPDHLQKTKLAIEHINSKIQHTIEMMKQEQQTCDENVNEYLKLASCADKQQLQRIKSVFEKKNQKSAQTISQYQKKLDNYNKRIKDLELNRVASHRQPKEVLREVGQGLKDVGANIRDGITGFSGGVVGNIKGGLSGLSQVTHTAAETVMSKPREFAHLIKNKFGSADNIRSITKAGDEVSGEECEQNHHSSATFTHRTKSNSGSLPKDVVANSNWFIELESGTKYTSEDECSSVTSGSGPITGTGTGTGTMSSPRNHPTAIATSSQGPVTQPQNKTHAPPSLSYELEQLLTEVKLVQHECQSECQRLHEDTEAFKSNLQTEVNELTQALQEERFRSERLEDQLNDLIELHQNEIENLKQCITDMEEKVQYQSEERLRDMIEMLDTCQTKISRLEHQQHQRESMVIIDGIENSNARAVAIKLINVLLTVLQVVLLLVATVSNIVTPFLKTRVRILTTTMLIMAVLFVCRQWSDVDSYLQQMHQRYGFGSSAQQRHT